jgi:hypothetical protein
MPGYGRCLISGPAPQAQVAKMRPKSFWTYLELANVSGWEEEVK